MKGASRDLMKMCIRALEGAYGDINSLKTSDAIGYVHSGKADTYGLDEATEEMIKHDVSGYDPDIALVTEETGKMYHGENGLEPTQVVLIADPTDRSIKLRDFLSARVQDDPSAKSMPVGDVLQRYIDVWERELGPPVISGASGSLTAIKDRKVLFNVMVNYVTGDMFVSSSLGNKHGKVGERFETFGNMCFPDTKKGEKYAAFLGKKGYPENLEQCQLGLEPEQCADPWAPGPTRILQLSDMTSNDIGFILSNGEKVCEWIGWLAWTKYARCPEQPDERSLSAYRIFFESPRTKDHVLVAPAPHYSMFRGTDGHVEIDLEKMFQLDDPSHYRETLVVVPVNNTRVIARIKALGAEHHELHL